MSTIWKYIQFLSLDVVAGAVISSLFVSRTIGVRIDSPILIGLGIAIWLIYTVDHLMDANAIKGPAKNPRHAFHQRNFKILVALAVGAFLLGLWNISFLRMETIKFGGILIFCVGVYFFTIRMAQRKSLLHKEVSAAMIYGFGVFAGPLSMTHEISTTTAFLFVQFFIIVLLNLFIFPLYEIESDRQDSMDSIAISLGEQRVRRMIHFFFALSFVMLMIGFLMFGEFWSLNYWFRAQYLLMAMVVVLAGLAFWPDTFKKRGLYRILGDGIFFIPALSLL